jgi:hypothetical protein
MKEMNQQFLDKVPLPGGDAGKQLSILNALLLSSSKSKFSSLFKKENLLVKCRKLNRIVEGSQCGNCLPQYIGTSSPPFAGSLVRCFPRHSKYDTASFRRRLRRFEAEKLLEAKKLLDLLESKYNRRNLGSALSPSVMEEEVWVGQEDMRGGSPARRLTSSSYGLGLSTGITCVNNSNCLDAVEVCSTISNTCEGIRKSCHENCTAPCMMIHTATYL